jgi:hypothetical protein
MLNSNSTPANSNGGIPLDLSSILLVEQDPELRDSRRILLGCLEHPVLAVGAYQDVCQLPRDSNCCLVAVDLSPNEHEARRIATHARLMWPGAKILLLGQPSMEFGDPLYDDSVSPSCNPSGVVETAKRLLKLDRPRHGSARTWRD